MSFPNDGPFQEWTWTELLLLRNYRPACQCCTSRGELLPQLGLLFRRTERTRLGQASRLTVPSTPIEALRMPLRHHLCPVPFMFRKPVPLSLKAADHHSPMLHRRQLPNRQNLTRSLPLHRPSVVSDPQASKSWIRKPSFKERLRARNESFRHFRRTIQRLLRILLDLLLRQRRLPRRIFRVRKWSC